MFVCSGNLPFGRKPRRTMLPISNGLVGYPFEGIMVADSRNQRDNKKKCSADTEQQDLCLVHNYLPI